VPPVRRGHHRGVIDNCVLLMRLCAWLALYPVGLPLRLTRSAIANGWTIAVPVFVICLTVTMCCLSHLALSLVRSFVPKPVGDSLQLIADVVGIASFVGGVGARALSVCLSVATGVLSNYISLRDSLAWLWSSSSSRAGLLSVGVPSFVSALGNVPFNPFLNVSSGSALSVPLVFTTVASHASVAFAPSAYASLRSGVFLADTRSLVAVVVGHAAKAASVSPAAALAGLLLFIVVSGVLRAWSDGE
jgi:hypothetical protein